VKSSQPLVRIDERSVLQQSAASEAQAAAARAQLEAAAKELERSRRLFERQYLSQAALDQAEMQFKAAEAQSRATLAQAGAAGTQTSFHTVTAPYAAVVASVGVEVGDLATPGRPLLALYDPLALRVVVHVPESAAGALKPGAAVRLEFPGAPEALRWQQARSIMVWPTADPATHTIQIRLDLPSGLRGLAPGMFARAWFALAGERDSAIVVPAGAVFQRSELRAVYVIDAKGLVQLRQVRAGRTEGGRTRILSGLEPGERVALDPLAAAALAR